MCMHQNIQSRSQKESTNSKLSLLVRRVKLLATASKLVVNMVKRPNHSPLRVMLLARRVESVGQLRIPRPLTHINSPIIFLNHPSLSFPLSFSFYTLSHQNFSHSSLYFSSLTLNLQSIQIFSLYFAIASV